MLERTSVLARGSSRGARMILPGRVAFQGGVLVLCVSACGESDTQRRASAADPVEPATRALVFHDEFVPIDDGTQIFVRSVGEGDPVLVVHGGPGMDHTYLLPGMETLGETHRVIFYDQRGTGESEAALDAGSISWRSFVSDPARIQDHLGLESVHVVAHSFGSLIATAFVLEHPDRVRSLVLVNPVEPGSRFQEETRAAALERRTEADAQALAELVAGPAFEAREPEAINEMYRLSFRGTMADPTRADELNLVMGERTAANGFAIPSLLFPSGEVPDLWESLSDLTVPTLVVVGEADPTPRTMVAEMVDRMVHARMEVIPAAGHFPFIEAPEAFFLAVAKFLALR